MNIVRHSKYRHVYGKVAAKDKSFDDIRFTSSPIDSNLIAVSKKFFAVIEATTGGGSFTVIPLTHYGRISRNCPRVIGHTAEVMDILFSPFDDNLIASASADTKVRIWRIPDHGLTQDLNDPFLELVGHERKVTTLCWHPTANNVLVSGGIDPFLIVWNTLDGTELNRFALPDGLSQCSFNYNGSKLAAVLRNKELVVLDPRSEFVMQSVVPHSGMRPARCVYVNGNRIFTCGFERGSSRSLALWDAADLRNPIFRMRFDDNRGHVTLHYEPEHEVVFVAGRGEGFVTIFEILREEPFIYYLTTYQSSNSSQKAFSVLPKLACNYMKCEIVRGFRGLNNGFCEVVSFTVPRKSESFQHDLFSEVRADVPAITADQYISGVNSDPVLVSLDPRKNSTRLKRKREITPVSEPDDKFSKNAADLNKAESLTAKNVGPELHEMKSAVFEPESRPPQNTADSNQTEILNMGNVLFTFSEMESAFFEPEDKFSPNDSSKAETRENVAPACNEMGSSVCPWDSNEERDVKGNDEFAVKTEVSEDVSSHVKNLCLNGVDPNDSLEEVCLVTQENVISYNEMEAEVDVCSTEPIHGSVGSQAVDRNNFETIYVMLESLMTKVDLLASKLEKIEHGLNISADSNSRH